MSRKMLFSLTVRVSQIALALCLVLCAAGSMGTFALVICPCNSGPVLVPEKDAPPKPDPLSAEKWEEVKPPKKDSPKS